MLFKKDRPELLKAILIFTTTILGLGIVLSFTRAAWVSLAGVVAIYVAMRLGFKLKLYSHSAQLFLLEFDEQRQHNYEMQRNKQDSSDNHPNTLSQFQTLVVMTQILKDSIDGIVPSFKENNNSGVLEHTSSFTLHSKKRATELESAQTMETEEMPTVNT